jgi:two-component system sensor histidine kinase RegB
MLMVWYVPLPGGNVHARHDHAAMQQMDHSHHHMDMTDAVPPVAEVSPFPLQDAFNIHVLGMWLGFVISAAVIAYFAVGMTAAVRQRDAQLNRVREETLRNERIVALGTLAASAAHELGTPLSTMSVVIGELRREQNIAAQQQDDLKLLDEQVKNCKRILDTLIRHAQETPATQDIERFVLGVLNEWQLLRPTVQYRYQNSGVSPAPQLRADPALRAALLNLLNNAADASPAAMDILLRWDKRQIVLEIHDHGPGLTPEVAARAGSVFFTTKQEGRGLGLFLANATLERLGGSVRLSNREGGGATTEVTLPLQESET